MTIEQLKSLKEGDVVRYTNKEDASQTYDSKVTKVSQYSVVLLDYEGNAILIEFDDPDLTLIASTLTLVEPTTTNELQIILHQIRDVEFDYTQFNIKCGFQGVHNDNTNKHEWSKDKLSSLRSCLADLRMQRDNLLRQNM